MKKILLLGGSAQQIVAIEVAKKMGLYTVLCDFLLDNPGQYIADKFYPVSTTDKEAVLKIAQYEKIGGVLAYASDPAAPTAAYVAEKMGLSGNPYDSVEMLCNKDKYREFLANNNFCTPKAKGFFSIDETMNKLEAGYFKFPVIIKPVDSSGSKGVSRCDSLKGIYQKLQYAMSFSRSKRIIVEEFIDKYGYQIAGDGLSIEGKLVFYCLANDHFNPKCANPFVPISASFPYNMPDSVYNKVHAEIQRLLMLLGMKNCTYNFDICIDKDYNVYLMEIAPRNGGNYIPQIIRYATGVDLIEYSVRLAMGETLDAPKFNKVEGFWAYYAVHSLEDGILDCVEISPEIEQRYIVENHLIKHHGDRISTFRGANTTLGCLLMKFNSMSEMLHMIDNSEEWITVKLMKSSK